MDSFANELLDFCESQVYTPENGHSVIMFGQEYKYNKTQSPSPLPIPSVMTSLIENNTSEFPEASSINQVLINKYEGSDCFLPAHSLSQVIHFYAVIRKSMQS